MHWHIPVLRSDLNVGFAACHINHISPSSSYATMVFQHESPERPQLLANSSTPSARLETACVRSFFFILLLGETSCNLTSQAKLARQGIRFGKAKQRITITVLTDRSWLMQFMFKHPLCSKSIWCYSRYVTTAQQRRARRPDHHESCLLQRSQERCAVSSDLKSRDRHRGMNSQGEIRLGRLWPGGKRRWGEKRRTEAAEGWTLKHKGHLTRTLKTRSQHEFPISPRV